MSQQQQNSEYLVRNSIQASKNSKLKMKNFKVEEISANGPIAQAKVHNSVNLDNDSNVEIDTFSVRSTQAPAAKHDQPQPATFPTNNNQYEDQQDSFDDSVPMDEVDGADTRPTYAYPDSTGYEPSMK